MYLKFEKTLWNWLLSSVLEKKNLTIGCLNLELRDLAKAAVLIGVWELTLILQFLLPRCRRFDSAIIQTPSTFTLHLNVHNIERTLKFYFLMWMSKHMWSMTTFWQVTRIFKSTVAPWRLPLPACWLFQSDTSSLPLSLNAVQGHVSKMEIKVDVSSTLEASALSPTKTGLFPLCCHDVS